MRCWRGIQFHFLLETHVPALFLFSLGNTVVIIGVVVGVVVLITVGLCIACNSKRKRTLNRETRGDRIPMTATTSATHRTQPPPLPPVATAVNPLPAPEVGYSPVPTAPPPPAYPYPLESPPPYPGGEGAPQYPPPGESYPWLQSSVSAKSSTSTTSP